MIHSNRHTAGGPQKKATLTTPLSSERISLPTLEPLSLMSLSFCGALSVPGCLPFLSRLQARQTQARRRLRHNPWLELWHLRGLLPLFLPLYLPLLSPLSRRPLPPFLPPALHPPPVSLLLCCFVWRGFGRKSGQTEKSRRGNISGNAWGPVPGVKSSIQGGRSRD